MGVGRGRLAITLLACVLLAAGCRHQGTPRYPEWAPKPTADPMADVVDNAFDDYAHAADRIEESAHRYADRVNFTPGQRAEVVRLATDPLETLASASKLRCVFKFAPFPPDKPPPHQLGWRLLGRAIAWRIDAEVAANDFDRAIEDLAVGSKFGFDLAGGCASDAALGLAIADEARRAFLPAIGKLNVKQFNAVSAAIDAALTTRPDLSTTVAHEKDNMLEAVQFVQDAYRTDEYGQLRKMLSSYGRDAIDRLEQMKSNDRKQRPLYFAGLAEDAEIVARHQAASATGPGSQFVDYTSNEDRKPWKVFAQCFFHGMAPIVREYDASLARERLLVLAANLRRDLLEHKELPQNLSAFTADMAVDPFSGRPFIYAVDGQRFQLYSVGTNGVDDGGETDETFSAPDLTLER